MRTLSNEILKSKNVEMTKKRREVNEKHNKDLAKGWGKVLLPKALGVKYPNAAKEFKWQYLFPSKYRRKGPRSGVKHRYHISISRVQRAVKKATFKARVEKKVTSHTFRHSFATHLLHNGYDIRTVQENSPIETCKSNARNSARMELNSDQPPCDKPNGE